MKEFIADYEVVLNIYFTPTVSDANDGDIVPHRKSVSEAFFYQANTHNNQNVYTKVYLERKMILDLADRIRQIESETIDYPYSNLPF
jgi:hypothetical protein